MEFFADILADAALDTLKLIPFLLVTYFAMECLEHKTGGKTQEAVRKAGAAGPAIGALLGAVPQCGFSAAAATLYAGRVVSLGTLFAVLLSTSDEMLPIFIAEQAPVDVIVKILLMKIALGMVFGFVVDALLRLRGAGKESLRIHELCQRDNCACANDCHECHEHPEAIYAHHDDCAEGCDHSHHHHDHEHDDEGWGHIFKSACIHTVEVTVFIFVVSLVLNGIISYAGEEALASFVSQNEAMAVVCSGVVGLIPNCAASIIIAQLYLEGVLGVGAMMSGLLVSSGVGLLVLFRANRPVSRSFLVAAVLLCFGILCGFAFLVLGITL